ncbi:transposase [Bathymodiolus platifrons methanotrophic gill symbiont]|uniref:transposase n=1 Tax=Bathymodiolus platifrons methanotrophic gill symbiont TaxID=113268 RepID=UPI001C8E0832|nr:transposase [Bathymodiolus platifrons methanotrophic gill symbiont]
MVATFLQAAEEVHEEQCPLSTYFKSLKSPRRVRMLEAVEQQSYDIDSETLSSHGIDYLKSFPELNDYTVLAADGHFIDHACHTEKGRNGKVYAAGFIYTLNLRNGLLRPFSLITNGTRRHQEIPVLRDELKRENRTKNSTQKCLYVYDKAVTDYAFWNNQIEHGNLMISVLKENSVATFVESIHFDTSHELNTGIESYSTYENNGIRFSIVNYRDPETKKLHRFITTLPGSINPGTIAMLYFKRWTIEKAFNNSKSNLKETKAWSSDNNSLKNQMRLTAMSYNLLRTVEELSKIQDPELIHPSDKKYTEDLEKRQQAAKKRGGFVNPLFFNERIARISSYTIRAVQNAIMTGKSLSSFINALVAKLVPRVNQIGEH